MDRADVRDGKFRVDKTTNVERSSPRGRGQDKRFENILAAETLLAEKQ